MTNQGKWPFNTGDGNVTAGATDKAVEREQARLAAEAARKQHQRHDRLIVGGKAHTKKHGLS